MTIKEFILEKILELGQGTLDAFFPAKYPEARAWRKLLGLDSDYKFSRKNFSKTLSRLHKEGIIKRIGLRKRAVWHITKEGRKYLRQKSSTPSSLKEDGKIRLIVFDVPEAERRKRRWLRDKLIEFNYKPLQKSVWLGKIPLPKQFLDDLGILEMEDYILVFDIKGVLFPER